MAFIRGRRWEVFSLHHAPYSTKFYTGGGGNTGRFNPLPFYICTIFSFRGINTFYLKNNTPYTYPTSLELCIPFSDCCIHTVLQILINHKNIRFSARLLSFAQQKNASVSPFGPFYRSKWQIFLPFHILHFSLSPPRVAFSRVGWFSRPLAFRSLYYPWGKMGNYS